MRPSHQTFNLKLENLVQSDAASCMHASCGMPWLLQYVASRYKTFSTLTFRTPEGRALHTARPKRLDLAYIPRRDAYTGGAPQRHKPHMQDRAGVKCGEGQLTPPALLMTKHAPRLGLNQAITRGSARVLAPSWVRILMGRRLRLECSAVLVCLFSR